MAKDKKESKPVTLIAPSGSKVTVSEDVRDKFIAKGYKAPSGK